MCSLIVHYNIHILYLCNKFVGIENHGSGWATISNPQRKIILREYTRIKFAPFWTAYLVTGSHWLDPEVSGTDWDSTEGGPLQPPILSPPKQDTKSQGTLSKFNQLFSPLHTFLSKLKCFLHLSILCKALIHYYDFNTLYSEIIHRYLNTNVY